MFTPRHRNTGPLFIETKYVSLPIYQGRCKGQKFQTDVTWLWRWLPSLANLYGARLGPFLTYESLFPWSHDIFQWDQGAAVKLGINDIPVLDDSEGAISSPAGQTVADHSDQLVGLSTFKRKPKQNRMSLHCSPSRKCMSPRPWKRRVSRFREWQLVSRMRQSHLTLRVTGTVHNSKSPDKFPL